MRRRARRGGSRVRAAALAARDRAPTHPHEPGEPLGTTDRATRRCAATDSAHLAAIVESAAAVIATELPSMRITSWNRGAEQLFGWTAEEALGRTVAIIVPPESRAAEVGPIRDKLLAGETVANFEAVRMRRDGTRVPVSITIAPVRGPDGRARGGASLILDMTSRWHAEAALRESEARYRALFEGSPVPQWIYDVELDRIVAVNDAALKLFGRTREEFEALPPLGPTHDAACARVDPSAASTAEPTHVGVLTHTRPDASVIEVDVGVHRSTLGGRDVGVVVALDVTERRRLENELARAQRLETMGKIAAGIAHDFNSLLSVILGYSDMLRSALRPDDVARRDLDEIYFAGRRGKAMTEQLLALGRQQELSPRIVSLGDVVADVERMLGSLVGGGVTASFDARGSTGRVRVDPAQIERVLMNLVTNARDAVSPGGSVTVTGETLRLEARARGAHGHVPPGTYEVLRVRDDGVGMTAETQGRLFEPFFSTKPSGRGTGLGLSTVLGIVEQSGGHLMVESAPGRGTTMSVLFPRCDDAIDERAGSTVMVVEDDEQLRRLIARILGDAGYVVLANANADEAMAASERHVGPIDVLLTDVVMPRMNGPQLAGRLVATRPGLRVVFMSGYARGAAAQTAVEREHAMWLQKPIWPGALLAAMNGALGAS